MYGETFYGRHTAQHQLQWSQIKIGNAADHPLHLYAYYRYHYPFVFVRFRIWLSLSLEPRCDLFHHGYLLLLNFYFFLSLLSFQFFQLSVSPTNADCIASHMIGLNVPFAQVFKMLIPFVVVWIVGDPFFSFQIVDFYRTHLSDLLTCSYSSFLRYLFIFWYLNFTIPF